jgi:hypothetical protein
MLSRINEIRDGICIIGVQQLYMVPSISLDVIINVSCRRPFLGHIANANPEHVQVYLTMLFLIPLTSKRPPALFTCSMKGASIV